MPYSALNCRIAIVEDDPDLRDSMLEYLQAAGFRAWGVDSGEALYRRLLVDSVDVVLLDLGLPGEDGMTILRHLRQVARLGLIIVSARQRVNDRLEGLSSGADAYLTKPVDLRELAAHIEAVHRRLNPPPEGTAESPVEVPPWQLVQETWRLNAPGQAGLTLTALEYRFINCLAQAAGRTVDKRQVASQLWGEAADVDFNRIDVMLARLRKKVQQDMGQVLPVKTVTAYGYALTVPCVLL